MAGVDETATAADVKRVVVLQGDDHVWVEVTSGHIKLSVHWIPVKKEWGVPGGGRVRKSIVGEEAWKGFVPPGEHVPIMVCDCDDIIGGYKTILTNGRAEPRCVHAGTA